MGKLIVFCDACILYPAPIRDLLMELAINDLLQLKWSIRVLDEWVENLLKNRPDLSRVRLELTKQNMTDAILDCLVEGYESMEQKFNLPDANDNHVLAAAVAAKADYIITANLKDFPNTYLNHYSMQAIHPDELFMKIAQQDEVAFLSAVKNCHAKLKKPPQKLSKYLDNLLCGCKLSMTFYFLMTKIDWLE